MSQPPLIVHAINRLHMGGLENGLVNLINNMPSEHFRHAILCMHDYSDFRERIRKKDVPVYAMNCRPGRDPALPFRIWRLFRRIKPAIVHGRNIAGLDALLPAAVAGIGCRIYAEHGRDELDPDGTNRKYRLLRKLYKPLVSHYVTVSVDLMNYVCTKIGVDEANVSQIYNGVDTERFRPLDESDSAIPGAANIFDGKFTVIGGVGRFSGVKDQSNLAKAFVLLMRDRPEFRTQLRLVMIGDGEEFENVQRLLREAGLSDCTWLPGARNDIASIMRRIDVFALPSIGEGISNTILESMASAVPVVATNVGGNPELVVDGKCGTLVPAKNPAALAKAIGHYVANPSLRRMHGLAARERVLGRFSLQIMVDRYTRLYESMIQV